jgi:DMSO/TMAO reductase YedYZ molybdopterin-dependent catalytic subunit
MALLRSTLQVRTVPERLLEWVLLLVPPWLVEASLQRFGFDAKRYALYVAILTTLATLTALGTLVLRRGWPGYALLLFGIGLWLAVMVIVMPLTSAGWFAAELIDGTWNAVMGYLAVSLVYAGCLQVARIAMQRVGAASPTGATSAMRRTALVGMGSALAALISTYLVQFVAGPQDLNEVRLLDPQEPAPSGGIDPHGTHPDSVTQPDTPAASPVQPTANSQPTREALLPEPRAARPMKRDKDGAILPAGRRQGELTDLITSNDDFYVVTKNAGGDPVVQPRNWRLRVDGEVQRPIELDYANLRKLPAVEDVRTLECISNLVSQCELAPFGCDLISTARWKGVRVASILDLAGGVKPGATFVAVIAADEFTSALPLEALMDPDSLLVYEMNGEVLPREHGYPARLLVPGHYGMKNAKWVIGLRPMRREFLDWYGQRSWSKDAVVKTMSRIDLPPGGVDQPPGEYNIAGVAYAGARGISRVEFSADDGITWQTANFVESPIDRDAWVRWIGRFTIEPDVHLTLSSRATDGTGAIQEQAFSLPEPDGSSGWPSLEVRGRQQ